MRKASFDKGSGFHSGKERLIPMPDNFFTNPYRENYLRLACSASEKPEPAPAQTGPDWSEDYPLDLPDDYGAWDWPDAPDPRVNDRARMMVVVYAVGCIAIIIACLAYLIGKAL